MQYVCIVRQHTWATLLSKLRCAVLVLLQLVAPPGQHVSGTVELLTLSPCRQLTCLEVLTSSRLYCPFTIKTVSLATLAWPNLAALRLGLAGAAVAGNMRFDRCAVKQHLSLY